MTDQAKQPVIAHKPAALIEADDNPQARLDWIATCAYFLAEARGFTPGGEVDDWVAAERAYNERGMAKGELD